jgi:hypothetical protein
LGACSAAAAELQGSSSLLQALQPLSSTAVLSRRLLHGGSHAADSPAAADPQVAAAPLPAPERSINWVKGVGAAALFIEAMLGVALPLLRRAKRVDELFDAGLLSLLNCFAGGVFITFGAPGPCLSTVELGKRQALQC